MGKEATCNVQIANESAQCKVLLESNEVIVRGPIRRKFAVASVARVQVQGDTLHFHAGIEEVALKLGPARAQSWARKLTTPPPTLAKKLGIDAATQLASMGEFTTPELTAAIAQAASDESGSPDLVLSLVKTVADLNHTLDLYQSLKTHPPIWIVYPKGARKAIGETEIRSTLRRQGFMDTKVASVSTTLTALRFNPR
jgi:hypothetical protein